jgi:hypothetical protein
MHQRYLLLIISLVLVPLISCSKAKEEVRSEGPSATTVTVTFFSGEVTILTASGEKKPELGLEIGAQDTIQTGNGALEVLVRDSGLVKIAKDSSVAISSLLRDGEVTDTNVHINYGKVVTVVRKERKSENYNVVTPTLVAGVRGTSFLTSVEKPGASGKSISCGVEDCLVKISVLEGKVAVRKPKEDREVILEKQSELSLRGSGTLDPSLVRPLGKDSFKIMKEMLVFHDTKVAGYENLAEELKRSSQELSQLESSGGLEEFKEAMEKKASANSVDQIKKMAKQADESKYLQKDISKDKLKLDPKESF